MKATHAGHCQACGRLQKLPGGRLSLHGYSVLYGFFSGTCVGSKHLPFEKSFHLVLDFIERAEAQLGQLVRRQGELRAPAATPRAWVHNYESLRLGKRGYVWREVEIDGRLREGSERIDYFYQAPGYLGARPGQPIEHRVDRFIEIQMVKGDQSREIATAFNRIYADWLEHEVDSLRRYIAWQRERIQGWKEQDLQPLNAKDDAGFKPTEPKY